MSFLQIALIRTAQAAAQAAANRAPVPQQRKKAGCTPCAAAKYVQQLRAQVAKR